ncbi:ubiquinol-cytochrome c reductase iron-sulfur subunit [Kiritimatiellaeota bacterium B1221]|nr:ubiquinol-cytochrome c reductase iron-sulfur subunit [Kiritimatiellaeota bacterium B1221]
MSKIPSIPPPDQTRLPSLGDRNKMDTQTPDMDRRTFLCWIAGGAVTAGTLLTMGTGALRLLIPNVHYGESPRIFLDPPATYPIGVTYLEKHRVYLVRNGNQIRALSGVCTHLGCSVNLDESGRGFHCPCHGSRFDDRGEVLRGPAARSLPWLHLERTVDGRVVVDRSREVSESEAIQV